MSKRFDQILSILTKEERYFTAKEIALRLDLSEKTIRDELTGYVKSSNENDSQIVMNKNGIMYQKKDDTQLEIRNNSNYGEERTAIVLRKLLLSNDYLKIENLADEMYVSVATMNRMIKKIKNILSEYGIGLVGKPSFGIKVSGKEIDKRLCFIHSFDDYGDYVDELMQECSMKKEDYYLITYIIQKSLDTFDYQITDNGLKNLAMHLVCSIVRVRSGNYLEQIPDKINISDRIEAISEMICRRMECEFHIVLPAEEYEYVCVHLIGKRLNMSFGKVKVSEKTEKLIDEVNEEIKKCLGYDFSDDFELFSMLSLHFEPMLSRVMYGLKIPNPILEDVKTKLAKGFECAVIAANVIARKCNLNVSDEELGYLAIHYNLAVERLNENKDIKYLLVCGSGMGTAKLLGKKIENQFHAKSENISVCGLNALKYMKLDKIDFIVSTVEIPFEINKKVIYIDNVLSDLKLLPGKNKNRLMTLLNENLMFFNKEFSERREIIDFLCEKVRQEYGVSSEFTRAVWKRENLSSTDIGNLIAIPHPYDICNEKSVMAICTLKKAIVWDKRKVKYIFMISFGKNDIADSHEINENLMSLLMDPKWVMQLETIDCSEKMMSLLLNEKE